MPRTPALISACLAALFSLAPALPAQTSSATAAHDYTTGHRDDLIVTFSHFLSMPNVAADPDGLRQNAAFLLDQLKRRGAQAQLLTDPARPETPAVVYGEIRTPGAQHTIVFYAHYDGQPVTPSDWQIPPFSPEVHTVNGEARIYARSAGDDKAALFAQLTALDALRAAHIPLRANIRFVWEGEEEAGSPHLEAILDAHRDLIQGDEVWLVCDGPVDQSGAQSIAFGARGDTHLSITVYGPHHGLHSGHYGNWAPNPAMELAQLLAGMKDANGHILIPHFYDGILPLSAMEKAAIARAPDNDAMLMQSFWLGHTENAPHHLLEVLNEPSLNINGLSSGATGAHAANVIPPTATADIDMRLVVGNDWKRQQQNVIDYIRSQGHFIVDTEPT
ncbi:MAG: M20/M25/M40 family metallo-hydrolase, partial [Acidobacteriaceae bacterium]